MPVPAEGPDDAVLVGFKWRLSNHDSLRLFVVLEPFLRYGGGFSVARRFGGANRPVGGINSLLKLAVRGVGRGERVELERVLLVRELVSDFGEEDSKLGGAAFRVGVRRVTPAEEVALAGNDLVVLRGL